MKRVLVLGATGAIATYLVPALLEKGMHITGVSLDSVRSDHPHLRYIQANALDKAFLKAILAEGYDAIVDFMVYPAKEIFEEYYRLYLENTSHYIFLSTYRIYAGEHPITEGSLRLLEAQKPADFVSFEEYSIYKAEEEDVLRNSPYRHFTIVRPAITYSKCRFQLTTLEANVLVYRMMQGKTVILPQGAMGCEATMSWAGDVARMLGAILFNPVTFGETYTVSTAEHHTWQEIAEIYERIGGLRYITVKNEEYIDLVGGSVYAKQQLEYDRCYDRIIDNTKILQLCGLAQTDLMPLEQGLRMELANLTPEKLARIGCNEEINRRMDAYLEKDPIPVGRVGDENVGIIMMPMSALANFYSFVLSSTAYGLYSSRML